PDRARTTASNPSTDPTSNPRSSAAPRSVSILQICARSAPTRTTTGVSDPSCSTTKGSIRSLTTVSFRTGSVRHRHEDAPFSGVRASAVRDQNVVDQQQVAGPPIDVDGGVEAALADLEHVVGRDRAAVGEGDRLR